jgi:predicted HD phosphohydrolase
VTPEKGTTMSTVQATSFLTASAEDWATAVEIGNRHYVATAGEAVLKLLASQKDDPKHGWQVNNYQHSLQCASRALRQGEDEEFVVCALLHDIGQELDPFGHDKIAAQILKPFVSEINHWVVENHQVFQLRFRVNSQFDVDACEKFRFHPGFEKALYFCEHYDQNCFDPEYDHLPLDTFAPLVRRLFSRVMERRLSGSAYQREFDR